MQAFLGDRALTTSDLRRELPDVPPASLYRHVARLVEAGVLNVVSERRVRGAVERTYVLRVAAASINLDEVQSMSREEFDPVRDGAGYRLAGLWLDDAEFTDFVRDLVRVIGPRLANAPRPGRRRRILGTIMLPGEDAPED